MFQSNWTDTGANNLSSIETRRKDGLIIIDSDTVSDEGYDYWTVIKYHLVRKWNIFNWSNERKLKIDHKESNLCLGMIDRQCCQQKKCSR